MSLLPLWGDIKSRVDVRSIRKSLLNALFGVAVEHRYREHKIGRMSASGQTKMQEFASKSYRDNRIAKNVAALRRAASACCVPNFKKKSWAPP
jgi:hypothetical protein